MGSRLPGTPNCHHPSMGRIRDVVEVRLKSEGPNNRSIPERVKASSQSRAQFGSGVASRRVSAPRGHAGSPMLRIRASVVPATAELRAVATDRDVFNAKDGSRRSEEHSRGKWLVAVVVAEG